ncbi:putative WD repeat-containing protein C3H5.08c [Choanephora cucurbitarum]|uniref:Putative WD repeat-containing protein C3H5.08c n=1 Tax=Choanephora cucurbitarum TaxID=101091 RepID=A0A1C7NG60_9FUNG|nr:putative WD repeat-containing protein C3H5.08c [Choanephora cucurbitarum]
MMSSTDAVDTLVQNAREGYVIREPDTYKPSQPEGIFLTSENKTVLRTLYKKETKIDKHPEHDIDSNSIHEKSPSASRKHKIGFFERIGIKRKQHGTENTNAEALIYSEDESDEDEKSSSVLPPTGEEEEVEASSSSITSFEDNQIAIPQTSIVSPSVGTSNAQLNPKYIKTKTKQKKGQKEFSRLVLAQTITTSQLETGNRRNSIELAADPGPNHPYGAIWAMRFSKDGRYLATAGQNCIIHVWKLINPQKQPSEDNIDPISNKIIDESEVIEYTGHTADILELAWSKNHFLLSSSIDHSVRLWHPTQENCLCVFQHPDLVTSVEFHPKDDRFFVSGCMDGRVRIWSIPEKRVAFWNEVPGNQCITAVTFTLDGKTVIIGTSDGHCFFYETQSLKYITQISISTSGRNTSSKKGPKITGIETMPGMLPGEEKILVTSNDSKIRLYNIKDKSLMFKYKGSENSMLQTKATFSDDGRYIISGSDNCHTYIWRTELSGESSSHHLQDARNKAISAFGHVDEASFGFGSHHFDAASTYQQQQQQKGGLSKWLKRKDDHRTDKTLNQPEFFEAHEHVVTTSVFAPTKTKQLFMKPKQEISPLNLRRMSTASSSSQSSSLIDEEATSSDGHIIVTSDFRGVIRVWRMDPVPTRKTSFGENQLDGCSSQSSASLNSNGNWSTTSTPSPRRRNLGGIFNSSRYPKQ